MISTSALARRVLNKLREEGKTLATAESCTGGLIAKSITDLSGSSAVFVGACVTYTNEIKQRLLGVDPEIFERETEVSEACARAMAQGVRQRLGVSVSVATTGYAGPTGGTETNPVGTVYLAVATEKATVCERFNAPQGATRTQVRAAATRRALEMLLSC